MAEAIRSAVLASIGGSLRPRLLDLGAGSGRIGWPFVAARDDYVGVDLSLGMLRAFVRRSCQESGPMPRLVRADGQRLPFRDAAFDAVTLIQLFGGMRGWRRLLEEARRVLRPAGALVLGRSVMPPDGVDAQMKRRLVLVLDEMGVQADGAGVREDAQRWLEANARGGTCAVAAAWSAERTARGFLERHRTGARFSALPPPVKQTALRKLSAWASETYGSLDAVFCEPHAFELRVFWFNKR